jgi:hypothetical protein
LQSCRIRADQSTIGPRSAARFTLLRAFQEDCREPRNPNFSPEGRDMGAFFVVHGHSKAEHKKRIAELIAANEATAQSLFICIMQFGSRE